MAITLTTVTAGTIGTGATGYVAKINNNFLAINAWSATLLDDVVTASLQDGDVLVYDLAGAEWNNSTKASADIADKTTADAHYIKVYDDTSSDTTKDKHVSNAFTKASTDHIASTTAHGATGAVVGTTNTQTLTNKTLTTPIISTISNTGVLTLPTSTDTLIGRDTTDTLTNKSLSDSTTYIVDNVDNTKKFQFQASGITTSTTRTLTIQNKDYTIADNADLTSHVANISNPHSVTHTQVGSATAQWNASKIKGVTVDDTNKANGRILKYNSTSTNLEYGDVTIGVGTEIDGGTASVPVTAMKIRRDTKANLVSSNPVLANSELVYVTDESFMKIGNGVTSFNSLPYLVLGSAVSGEANTASSVGGHNSVYYQKSGVDLQFKSIQAGANVVVTDNGTYLTFSATSTVSNIDNTFAIVNSVDPTKQIAFSASSITTATTRTITVPDKNIELIDSQDAIFYAQVFS